MALSASARQRGVCDVCACEVDVVCPGCTMLVSGTPTECSVCFTAITAGATAVKEKYMAKWASLSLRPFDGDVVSAARALTHTALPALIRSVARRLARTRRMYGVAPPALDTAHVHAVLTSAGRAMAVRDRKSLALSRKSWKEATLLPLPEEGYLPFVVWSVEEALRRAVVVEPGPVLASVQHVRMVVPKVLRGFIDRNTRQWLSDLRVRVAVLGSFSDDFTMVLTCTGETVSVASVQAYVKQVS